MKDLKDLTPEILAKIPEYQERALRGIFDGKRYASFDLEKATAAIAWHYNQINVPMPRIIVAENPLEQQLIIAALKAKPDLLDKSVEEILAYKVKGPITIEGAYLFTLNVYSNAYYAWYEFLRKELVLELTCNEMFQEVFALQRASDIYSCIFAEEVCVPCKYPKQVLRNDNGLHCTTGTSVTWGYVKHPWKCYYINGRHIENSFFEKCLNNEITLDEYLKLDNDEQRSAVYMLYGEEKMFNFLGATAIDSTSIVHRNGEVEEITLFKTTKPLNSVTKKPYAWLKRICPSTGTVYLTPTNPDFTKALDSSKFHRPSEIPIDRPYLWNSRS